ncbi:MAG: hypothetical protein WCD77_08295, partial [Acidobacteriaceae bacterium]
METLCDPEDTLVSGRLGRVLSLFYQFRDSRCAKCWVLAARAHFGLALMVAWVLCAIQYWVTCVLCGIQYPRDELFLESKDSIPVVFHADDDPAVLDGQVVVA